MAIVFSNSFMEFLRSNFHQSKICKMLWKVTNKYYRYDSNIVTTEECNYITFRGDGTISYLPAGKEHKHNDSGDWAREGRQFGKAGRVIRKLFTKAAIKRFFVDADFETFANNYKATFNDDGYAFELLGRDKIKDVYDMRRAEGSASLNGSCMNGDSNCMDIYEQCKSLQILVMKNKDGLLCGRALVWTLEDGTITLMDRVYVVQDFMYERFVTHCMEKGMWRKVEFRSFDDKDFFVTPTGDKVRRSFTVHTPTDFDSYPYIDTFSYGGDGFLTNNYGQPYEYNNTSGERTGDHDDQTEDEINGGWIDNDDARYIDSGDRRYRGRTTHMDNVVYVNGNYYHEDDSHIVEVDGDWYEKDSDDVREVDGEWYKADDCSYCDIDDEYYLTDDCVWSDHSSTYILKTDAYEVAGNYYHENDVDRVA